VRTRLTSDALQALAWREAVPLEIDHALGEAVVTINGREYWASLRDRTEVSR
jgi:hypothetical protein